MTRFIHDQFAKDYLETLLAPFGTVKAPRRVSSEARQIDVWFTPSPTASLSPDALGLLGRLTLSVTSFEPFRNPVAIEEIQDCLLKLLQVLAELRREAKRHDTQVAAADQPNLWILTPTASPAILATCRAQPELDIPGVYGLAEVVRTAIVVIHQLPPTPETLWLRLLGRGHVQKRAFDELERLPVDHPFQAATLELFYNLQQNLRTDPNPDLDDQELIMRLAPLYQQDRARAKEEGREEGREEMERLVVENLLQVRFGTIDPQLEAIIDRILALSVEEFTPLLVQLSRQELLDRFQPPD